MNPNAHYGQKNTIVALPALPPTSGKKFLSEKKKSFKFNQPGNLA